MIAKNHKGLLTRNLCRWVEGPEGVSLSGIEIKQSRELRWYLEGDFVKNC